MAAVFKWEWTNFGADAWTSSFGTLHTSPIATTRFNETRLWWSQILRTQNTVIVQGHFSVSNKADYNHSDRSGYLSVCFLCKPARSSQTESAKVIQNASVGRREAQ